MLGAPYGRPQWTAAASERRAQSNLQQINTVTLKSVLHSLRGTDLCQHYQTPNDGYCQKQTHKCIYPNPLLK